MIKKSALHLSALLLIIAICSCRQNSQEQKEKDAQPDKKTTFISEDQAFTEYLGNFNEITLPFELKNLWDQIGSDVTYKVDRNSPFYKNRIMEKVIIDKSSETLGAYKIPFNKGCIGLIYTIQDNLNHQVILVTYDTRGKALSAISVHGEFKDSEYRLDGIINQDLSIEVYESIYVLLEDNKPEHQMREARKYHVTDTGEIIAETGSEASAASSTDNLETELIGIWHVDPVVSSALGRTLTFFPDRTYRERAAEGTRGRYVYTKGSWEIADTTITLTPEKEGFLEGGEEVQNSATETSTIEGAVIAEKDSEHSEKKLSITGVEFNKDFNKKTVTIGGKAYYKLDDNPEENYWYQYPLKKSANSPEERIVLSLFKTYEDKAEDIYTVKDRETANRLHLDESTFLFQIIDTLNVSDMTFAATSIIEENNDCQACAPHLGLATFKKDGENLTLISFHQLVKAGQNGTAPPVEIHYNSRREMAFLEVRPVYTNQGITSENTRILYFDTDRNEAVTALQLQSSYEDNHGQCEESEGNCYLFNTELSFNDDRLTIHKQGSASISPEEEVREIDQTQIYEFNGTLFVESEE